MKSTERRRWGQSLAEVLLAVVFLATGGLVIYSSAVRAMQGAGWEADRVFGQGLLRDLLEVYGQIDFCTLDDPNGFPGVRAHGMGDVKEEDSARKIAEETGFQEQFEKDDAPIRPLQFPSFYADPTNATPKDEMEKKDIIYKEYRERMNVLQVKRIMLFKKDTTGGKQTSAVLSAYVFFTATNGARVTLKAHTVVFKNVAGACP